jgi:DNA processing protein
LREPAVWPRSFVAGTADREAILVLASLEGILPRDLHSLAWREGSASRCLAAVRAGVAGSANDREIARSARPAAIREALARCAARVAAPGDDEYPNGVLHLPDPPICLFIRGRRMVPWPAAVTVVGARRCTSYGREMAEAIGEGLAAAGVAVISGAAIGIDAAAHKGALLAGGPTVAVLGSGIDVIYPPANAELLAEIEAAGTVVSEFPPGIRALPHRFPRRNRLVAALGIVAVVVEGAEGSGSLITADLADQMGKDILAVPGPVTAPQSAAPHELIRDGATLVRGPEDVLEAIGMAAAQPDDEEPDANVEHLPPEERAVLERLSGTPAAVDALAVAAGLSPSEALTALSGLELRGLVASEGGRYRRIGARPRRRVVGTRGSV